MPLRPAVLPHLPGALVLWLPIVIGTTGGISAFKGFCVTPRLATADYSGRPGCTAG